MNKILFASEQVPPFGVLRDFSHTHAHSVCHTHKHTLILHALNIHKVINTDIHEPAKLYYYTC